MERTERQSVRGISRLTSLKYADRCLVALAMMLLAVQLTGCVDHPTSATRMQGVDHYINGAIAYQNGQMDRAIAELQAAVAENPSLTMPHVLLGDIYRSRHDFRNALDQYQAAVRLDPYEYRNHYNLAIAYQYLNRLQESAASYLRALKLEPRDLNSTMNLGLVFLALDQPEDAVRQMRRAVAIAPKSADAHCNLAVALEAQDNLAEAQAEYYRALELDSTNPVLLMNLAGNMIMQGDGHGAVVVMKMLLKKGLDSAAIRDRYGDALVLSDRDDEAYAQYALALEQDGRCWQAMNQIGMILIRRYDAGLTLDESLRERALKVWRNSIQIEPHQPNLQILIDKYYQNGRVMP